jgi:hypothetical protein
MRTAPLASLSLLFAVVAAALVSRVPEEVAVGMVVVPLVVLIVGGLFLFAKEGGWRQSHGLREWLLFGPVQAQPDKLASRVARVPAVVLSFVASIAVGAIVGMIAGGAA